MDRLKGYCLHIDPTYLLHIRSQIRYVIFPFLLAILLVPALAWVINAPKKMSGPHQKILSNKKKSGDLVSQNRSVETKLYDGGSVKPHLRERTTSA